MVEVLLTYRWGEQPSAGGEKAREQQLAQQEMTRDHEEAHQEQVARHVRKVAAGRPPTGHTSTTLKGEVARVAVTTHSPADLVTPGERFGPFTIHIIAPAQRQP